MEHSIQDIAKAAGTTSRTLRHYDSIGLLPPSRIGANGYRYYDDRALVRLQRILLLRELGLGLEAIAEVLETQDAGSLGDERPETAEARILTSHLELLHRERDRIDAQIGAVGRTISVLRRQADAGADAGAEEEAAAAAVADADGAGTEAGEDLMSQNMFEGFDHTRYREEVEERWGKDAYARSDRWWRGLSEEERRAWRSRVAQLSADWSAAAERGEDPDSPAARELARRHVEWLTGIPGTPAWKERRRVSPPESAGPLPSPASAPGGDLAGYVRGLAEMYVADERFAANYGGAEGASFVRDALVRYVERELSA